MALPEGWEPRHVEAYTAWKQGDQNRLIEACVPEIRKLAYKLASTSRRRGSDELRQPSRFDRFEEGRKREAALRQAGLREAKEVADFEELYSAGCQAVLEAKDRYDPETETPFQAFAYKRIRGAMIDLLNEKREQGPEQAHDSSEIPAAKAIEELVALVEKGEQDISVFIELVARYLEPKDLDGWRAFIQSADFKVVRFFWWFLYQFADELDLKVGRSKRIKMLGVATRRHWYLLFKAAADQGRKTVDISGPLYMEIMERRRRTAGLLPAKVDDRLLGKVIARWLGRQKPIDGKTIGRWRRRLAEARVRSSTVDWNSITDPRLGRRIERRRRQDSH
jgi:RNA polymerase sigma factor (sigma-70 family)